MYVVNQFEDEFKIGSLGENNVQMIYVIATFNSLSLAFVESNHRYYRATRWPGTAEL